MQTVADSGGLDLEALIPFSKAWKEKHGDVLSNAQTSGQALLDFYLESFPKADEPFLRSLEKAAAAGDLKAFSEAADRGLPMDLLPKKPVIGGSVKESSIVFAPLNRAIENEHQDFVVALTTGTEFHRLIETHQLSESASKALIVGRQTKSIASLFESNRLADRDLVDLTKKIIQSLDLDLWKAAALSGSRFFNMKDENLPQQTSVLAMAIVAGNESVFDACIQRGQRPWQKKLSGSESTTTAFDHLCQGRDSVLNSHEGTSLDREDLARRTSMAHKLNAFGFGPAVTNAEGGNAAHAAAAWRTPDLMDVALSINPDLNKPRADGGHPLHCVASNVSRGTTAVVLDQLVGVLKKHGADMDCRDFKGDNPAQTAIHNQMGAVLEALVAGGVPLNSRNNFNAPPIEGLFGGSGAISKRGAFLASCMRAGLDVNTELSTGKTLMETLLGKGKQWHEAVNTIRAFKARSSALNLIDEIENESKPVSTPSP